MESTKKKAGTYGKKQTKLEKLSVTATPGNGSGTKRNIGGKRYKILHQKGRDISREDKTVRMSPRCRTQKKKEGSNHELLSKAIARKGRAKLTKKS